MAKIVQISLSDESAEWLADRAAEVGQSQSAFGRFLIESLRAHSGSSRLDAASIMAAAHERERAEQFQAELLAEIGSPGAIPDWMRETNERDPIEQLHAAWLQLNEQALALLEESQHAGEAVLAATLEGDASKAIAAERSRAAELTALEDAIRQTYPKRRAAIRERNQQQADEIRKQAEPLRKKAEKIRLQRQALLDELKPLRAASLISQSTRPARQTGRHLAEPPVKSS